jgi:hypothetical protein
MCQFGVSGFAIACLCFTSLVHGQAPEENCPSTNTATEKSAQPPCGCPMWRIEEIDEDVWLYHALYYAQSCNDAEAISMYGNLTLSTVCGDAACLAPYTDLKGPQVDKIKEFPGIKSPIDITGGHQMPLRPDGLDRQYSVLLDSPINGLSFKYIAFNHPASTPTRYAKVFTYALDFKRRYANPQLKNQLIHFAKELKPGQIPPASDTVGAVVTPLDTPDGTGACQIFKAKAGNTALALMTAQAP